MYYRNEEILKSETRMEQCVSNPSSPYLSMVNIIIYIVHVHEDNGKLW